MISVFEKKAVRSTLSLSIFVVIGILFPLAIIWEAESVKFSVGSLGTFIILFISAIKISVISFRKKVAPLALTFWIFVAFWMGLSAFAQTVSSNFPLPGIYSEIDIARGVFIVFLALIAYEFGRISKFKKKKVRKIRLDISILRVYLITFFAIITSIYAVWQLGGIDNILVGRKDWALNLFDSGNYSTSTALVNQVLLRVPSFVALLSTWYLWCHRSELMLTNRQKTYILCLLAYLIIHNSITNFPLGLARYWLGSIMVSMVFIWLNASKRSLIVFSTLLITALLIVFPLASEFRNLDSMTDVFNVEISGVVSQLYGGDYDAFQQLVNTVQHVDRESLSWGENFIGAALFWVPRSIWVDKPYGTGMLVAEGLGYDYTNLSAPLWGEAYYAFGYIGVCIILYLYGLVSARLDRIYQSENTKNRVEFLIVPFLIGFQIFLLRGDLLNAVAYSIPTIVTMLIFFRKKEKI